MKKSTEMESIRTIWERANHTRSTVIVGWMDNPRTFHSTRQRMCPPLKTSVVPPRPVKRVLSATMPITMIKTKVQTRRVSAQVRRVKAYWAITSTKKKNKKRTSQN